MKLDKEIKEKRPELATRKGVMFHQDNARPHTSLNTIFYIVSDDFPMPEDGIMGL